MNYILATGSTVIEYPYSTHQLKRDNPNTSFLIIMTDEELSAWNVFPVTEQPSPDFNEQSENVEQLPPNKINGIWTLEWKIVQASDEEKTRRTEAKAMQRRKIRNEELRNSDFTQLPDFTGSEGDRADWKIYRQALRDIPTGTGFPWQLIQNEMPIDLMKRIGVIT